MKLKLVVDSAVCCGCLSCVTNCAQHHDGHAAAASARIEVELEPFSGLHRIVHCHHCDEPECAAVCPQGAIQPPETGPGLVVDLELCIDCHQCIEACPHGAMRHNPFAGHVIKCDLCGGEPRCVQSCFTGALWIEREQPDPPPRPDKLQSRYFWLERTPRRGGGR